MVDLVVVVVLVSSAQATALNKGFLSFLFSLSFFFSFLANVLLLQYQNFSNNNYCFINPLKVR